MKLSFYGAAREVTGSNYLIEAAGKRVLVDCGMFHGRKFGSDRNREPFAYDPASIDAVLVTHAHADHIGRIPKLMAEGFSGTIHATEPTKELMRLMLADSAKIMAEEAKRRKEKPVFEKKDVDAALRRTKGHRYKAVISIGSQFSAKFQDAGHILGSAVVEVTAEGKRIAFSGDFGNPPTPILRDPYQVRAADYVVCESTYGSRLHEDPYTRLDLVRIMISETVNNDAVMLVPAFSLERTQEILYAMNEVIEREGMRVPIYLDSPLAIRATKIYGKHPSYFDKEARDLLKRGDDFFDFPGLEMTLSTAQSKGINDAPTPKIILAASGMMTGGRIMHHLKRYISDPGTRVFITGYQASGTLGRRILEGAKTATVHGKRYPVRAKVKAIGAFSGHADQLGLMNWIAKMSRRPKLVFCTHGESDSCDALSHAITTRLRINSYVPEMGESVEL